MEQKKYRPRKTSELVLYGADLIDEMNKKKKKYERHKSFQNSLLNRPNQKPI